MNVHVIKVMLNVPPGMVYATWFIYSNKSMKKRTQLRAVKCSEMIVLFKALERAMLTLYNQENVHGVAQIATAQTS